MCYLCKRDTEETTEPINVVSPEDIPRVVTYTATLPISNIRCRSNFEKGFHYTPDESNIFQLNINEKLIVVSDLGGDLDKTIEFLKLTHLINDNYEWLGKGNNETTLVVLGGICGKGCQSWSLYQLLIHLRNQTTGAFQSGRVIILAGLRELMLVLGFWSIIDPEEKLITEAVNCDYYLDSIDNNLSPEVLNFLTNLPIVCVVGNVACSYAGIVEEYADIDMTNKEYNAQLVEVVENRNNEYATENRLRIDYYKTRDFQKKYPLVNGLSELYSRSPILNNVFQMKRAKKNIEEINSLNRLRCNVMAIGHMAKEVKLDVKKYIAGEYLVYLNVGMSRFDTVPMVNNRRFGFLYVYNDEYKVVYVDRAEFNIRFLEDTDEHACYHDGHKYRQKLFDHGVVHLVKGAKLIDCDSIQKEVANKVEFFEGNLYLMTLESVYY